MPTEAETRAPAAPVFDGEDYTREGLEQLVAGYTTKQRAGLQSLDELKQGHARLSEEMAAELADQTGDWERLARGDRGASGLGRLLRRLPGFRSRSRERPLHAVLTDKLEAVERRTREVGNYLDRIQAQMQELETDIARLHEKLVRSAQQEKEVAARVVELEATRKRLEEELLGNTEEVRGHELESQIDAARHEIWELGARLRLCSSAEGRIGGIIKMNNQFLEILRNLHGNMEILYEAGNEVLGELRGNLAALASAAKASELSLDLKQAMASLRQSVNKVAALASETSLYLTQNVDKMAADLTIYDRATETLVENNLREERAERQVAETLALAAQGLRQGGPDGPR
jgi:chromosome segregation ATPase